MTTSSPSSLHRLIALVQQHRPAAQSVIVTAASNTDDATAAQHTSWDLLTAGLSHLADGGVNGENGLLTTAISRASLRSAPLASALGIAPPIFKLTTLVKPSHSAHAQAVFLARRMSEAVMGDIDKSTQMVARAMNADRSIDTGTRSYFSQLADVHRRQCQTLLLLIDRLPPPQPHRGGSFRF